MAKSIIKEVVVVEGKTDSAKLKSLFIVDTIETNGSYLSKKTINLIKQVANIRGVILFLDPDGPGEQIRRRLEKELIQYKQAFVKREAVGRNKKVGIAESNDRALINALKNVVTFNKKVSTLSWDEYLSLNLDSKAKRLLVSNHYGISEVNNKQMFNRLNLMGVTLHDLTKNILPRKPK